MSDWNKTMLHRENGDLVEMQMPLIISASRSTDIPAFYAEWFFDRLLNKGYSCWTNPFNGRKFYISYEKTKFIVFWSKNPNPLLNYLDKLKHKGINCYIQFTLNDYEQEKLEPNVPNLSERIDTFKQLTDALGKGHVIWRFDPLILTDQIDEQCLLAKIENIGDQLHNFSEKLVFSYADIDEYKKVKINLQKNHIDYKIWNEEMMFNFAKNLCQLKKQKHWNYLLATCGEKINLSDLGIIHNACIDEKLIVRFAHQDRELMQYLNVKFQQQDFIGKIQTIPIYTTHGEKKDTGQRITRGCGCIKSKDIGEYNTCKHFCKYCYANTSEALVEKNYRKHQANPFAESITGD